MRKARFLLYKIYYSTEDGGDVLVYIGRTKQPLNNRLRGHFFKKPMMRELDINQVARVEYAEFNTEADMNVMEVILINRYKPGLNKDDKANDELTIPFPAVPFYKYDCHNFEKWKREIAEIDATYNALRTEKNKLFEEHHKMRRMIFSRTDITSDEKASQWALWLINYYEPKKDELDRKGQNLDLW